jgi:hypothetical protein
MERGEESVQIGYEHLREMIPEVDAIVRDENDLMNLVDEERLCYIGSIVLGLNDVLVEFTGALWRNWTFVLQNTRLVTLSGLIIGIAAALSMGGGGVSSRQGRWPGQMSGQSLGLYRPLLCADRGPADHALPGF